MVDLKAIDPEMNELEDLILKITEVHTEKNWQRIREALVVINEKLIELEMQQKENANNN